MPVRPVPTEAIDLTAHFEGFMATAYLCPAGVPTIGYGHTRGITRDDVGHTTITEQRARAYLMEDMAWAQNALEAACGVNNVIRLSDLQYSAMLSFAFNVGAAPTWTIWQKIKAGADADVPEQLLRFVNAAGHRLPGLVARREAEAAMWREGMAAPVLVPPPAAPPPAPTQRQSTPPTATLPRPPRPVPAPAPRQQTGVAVFIAALMAIIQSLVAFFASHHP